MYRAFKNGELRESDTDIAKILRPVSFFDSGARRSAMRKRVLERLCSFFDRFLNISDNE